MSKKMWVPSHLERPLAEKREVRRIQADGDGDYPWPPGTAIGWVSGVDARDRFMVQVWAHAAYDVNPSAKLLRELNDIQVRSFPTPVCLAGNTGGVERTISPIGLTQPVLPQALTEVPNVADDIGLRLAGMYGGRTPLAPAATAKSEDAA